MKPGSVVHLINCYDSSRWIYRIVVESKSVRDKQGGLLVMLANDVFPKMNSTQQQYLYIFLGVNLCCIRMREALPGILNYSFCDYP